MVSSQCPRLPPSVLSALEGLEQRGEAVAVSLGRKCAALPDRDAIGLLWWTGVEDLFLCLLRLMAITRVSK